VSKKSESKKTISPLPPIGDFPGYKRGAAVFNAWAQGLFEQSNVWNDVWSKMKGKSLTADEGVQAFVSSVECTARTTEAIFQALMTGSGPADDKKGK